MPSHRGPVLKPAQRDLIERYVPLAEHVARKRSFEGRDLDEVHSDALFGLTRAALRFDPDRGADFAAYARVTIEGAIKQGRRDRSAFDRATYYSDQRPIVLSLDAPLNTQSGASLLDVLSQPEIQSDGLSEAVNHLSAREQLVIKLYYWWGLSQREIGKLLGVHQVHASRIQRAALVRLRERLTGQ